MGYDLHITRAQDWTDSESIPITGAEWKALVASDPQLELIGAAEAAAPDGVLRYENPGLARWSGHTTDEEVWFDLRQGRVVVKNPDEATIAKMVAVASALGARVVGDDGETYDSSGVPPGPPPVSFAQRVAAWFQRMRPSPAPDVALPPFAVGARVRGMGGEGTVVSVDPQAMHGHGTIEVRFDDGRVLTYSMFAHDLTEL